MCWPRANYRKDVRLTAPPSRKGRRRTIREAAYTKGNGAVQPHTALRITQDPRGGRASLACSPLQATEIMLFEIIESTESLNVCWYGFSCMPSSETARDSILRAAPGTPDA